ncbi:Permease of the drug/metabolite transporter (DMT) superfamily [Cognatiyoonia koreensis]|uniref:Permease of the drug/metabolite transporter (DMT) superfamily n=1 Tax=Cognatiyoonia koreensis TaxID=364200 RepID=A0A1I0PIC3_9RHOB|nr:DMT family transporter [Cognatiyoonia koreensis]SEW13985.1 Permease of the drug/metabolite transporter (DMT) superfamily [Cognatiyoonia koreensis]
MTRYGTDATATLIVLTIGVLWGFYWWPVRGIAAAGLEGAWGTAAATGCAVVVLMRFAFRDGRWRKTDLLALLAIATGGAAFTLYSVGFIYGRVALVTLLFYLTPVWSTLLTRFLLGWDTPRLRIIAMGIGLLGLLVILGAKGDWPIPRNTGEWLGLASGLFWALGSTGIRARPEVAPVDAAFVFALGGCVAALACGAILPEAHMELNALTQVITLSAITGAIWWAFSIPLLMWATARLDPARVGMLLMSEVLVGIASAAIIAGERITPLEIVGGGLVLLAGVLEVWPSKGQRQ